MDDPDTSAANDDATPSEEQVAARAHLSAEERVAGSDDPAAQARAILSESEERTDAVVDDPARDGAGWERRTSDENVDPPAQP